MVLSWVRAAVVVVPSYLLAVDLLGIHPAAATEPDLVGVDGEVSRVGLQRRELRLQLLGKPGVITVEKCDPRRSRLPNPQRAGGADSPEFGSQVPDARISGVGPVPVRAVGGAVVHDDQIPVTMGLSLNRLYVPNDKTSASMGRKNDTDENFRKLPSELSLTIKFLFFLFRLHVRKSSLTAPR